MSSTVILVLFAITSVSSNTKADYDCDSCVLLSTTHVWCTHEDFNRGHCYELSDFIPEAARANDQIDDKFCSNKITMAYSRLMIPFRKFSCPFLPMCGTEDLAVIVPSY